MGEDVLITNKNPRGRLIDASHTYIAHSRTLEHAKQNSKDSN